MYNLIYFQELQSIEFTKTRDNLKKKLLIQTRIIKIKDQQIETVKKTCNEPKYFYKHFY